jgi:hypothetical protein
MYYYNSAGTFTEYVGSLSMTGWAANYMSYTPTYSSSSNVIGATSQTLTVTFRLVGIMPTDG